MWPYVKLAYTRATAAVAPASVAASRLRGCWLPRTSVAELGAAAGARSWVVREAEDLVREAPHGDPPGLKALRAQMRERVARQAVAVLPGARVLGVQRAVIDASGALVTELSPYFGTRRPQEHPLYLHPLPRAPRELDAEVGLLAARGDMNYYHFVLDVLPRLELLESCPQAPAPALWYVPAALPFQRELLDLAGVPVGAVVDSAAHPHVRARRLVAPTLPDPDLKTPPWTVEFLRRRLLGSDGVHRPWRRLYVTRGHRPHSRIVLNEDEVLARLAPLGFEVVDPGSLSVREQITTFAAANVVVGPHGGGLTNLVFAPPGAVVVELFPPDYIQGCYWKISACLPDVRYRYLVGRGRPPGRMGMTGVASDIWLDAGRLLALLAAEGVN